MPTKQDHDNRAEEATNMVEIVKRLGWAEEALKEARLERDNNRKANDEMTQQIVKQEAEIKMELNTAQFYAMEYSMKEEELANMGSG